MSPRSWVAVALLALISIAGCRAAGGDVPVVVRNLSPEAITFVTEEPGSFLFSNTVSHTIQPWKKGDCYARLGLYRGHIKLTVSGSNVAAPATYETTPSTTSSVVPDIGVQIDADDSSQARRYAQDEQEPETTRAARRDCRIHVSSRTRLRHTRASGRRSAPVALQAVDQDGRCTQCEVSGRRDDAPRRGGPSLFD